MKTQKLQYMLKNKEIQLFLGVPPAERAKLQTIQITISFTAENNVSHKEDTLTDAPDYHQIYILLENWQKKEIKTLEALHFQIYSAILGLQMPIADLQVHITKKPYPDATVTVKNT